ncbi:MAG: SPFH domain-containing protein [Phycisphaerae bacterium]
MRRIPIASALVFTIVIGALLLYGVSFQVRFNEVAILIRLGKADARSVVSEQGFHWKLPPPIEYVVSFDTRYQVLDTLESEVKTREGNNLIVGCYAIWRIKDPLQFYVRAKSIAEAQTKIRERINASRATIVGQRRMSDFVNLDAAELERGFDGMQNDMLAEAAPGLLADFGVELVHVGVRRVSLPEDVTRTVIQSMISERNSKAAGFRQEGAARAEATKARAESIKNQILSFAKRRAAAIESQGVEASKRYLEQIQEQDQELFIFLRGVEALQNSLKENATIFIDSNSPLYKFFFGPQATDLLAAPEKAATGIAKPASTGAGQE